MADPQIILPALLLFLISDCASGIITLSDYKICGDPECERPMSRVRATKYHKGPDCRFLNFKRGDIIFVHYKLSGERDDLWAGAIDKNFGYFPKEAVDIEEIYTQEEIRTQTQEQDFFCMDEYGVITESEQDNHANQNEDKRASENVEQHPKKSKSIKESPSAPEKYEFTEEQDSHTSVQVNPDKIEQKSTEQGGSYWIGSHITGWLGLGDQSDDGSQEQTEEQDSFRSRKLSLDLDGNQLGKGPTSKASGWLERGLTNMFGFGQRNPEVNVEETNEREKLTHQNIDQTSMGTPNIEEAGLKHQDQPAYLSSWLNIGINDILSFNEGKGDATGENRYPETSVDERLDIDNEVPDSMHSTVSQVGVDEDERSEEAKEETSKIGENIHIQPVSSHIDAINEKAEDYMSISEEKINIENNERTGWYSSVYNSISGFYNKKPEVENGGDITPGYTQEAVSHRPGSDAVEKGMQDESEKGMKSMFSADIISSIFSSLTLGDQLDVDIIKDLQNNKESTAELENEGKEALFEAQSTANIYKIETMSERKLASEEITLDDKNLDLQQTSSDYLDRGIGILNNNNEREQKTPESKNVESAVHVESPDSNGLLRHDGENINILPAETEQIQLYKKKNAGDKNVDNILLKSEDLLNEHNNLYMYIESTGTSNQTASTQSLIEENMSALELTETSDIDNVQVESSKFDGEIEPKEVKAYQSKDCSNENSQRSTADHIRHSISELVIDQIHTPSTSKASVNDLVEKPGFNEVHVQDPDTDGTLKNIVTEEGEVEKSLDMITYKNEDKDISLEEPFQIQEDKGNIDIINADVTGLQEALQEQHSPAKTFHIDGCKSCSTFTSTGYNVPIHSELDVIGDLQLRSPNKQNIQANQESLDATLDLPTQSSSPDLHKSNEFYESEESKYRSNMASNEQQSITEANGVDNGPGVYPAQDPEELENYSTFIQKDSGTRSKSTSRPNDFSVPQSAPNYLPGATADGVLKQKEKQRDIHLKEIKSHDNIQYVDGNSEQIDPQNVKEDHFHQLLSCSHSQTETCIHFVDGEKVYQTSPEEVKTEVPRETDPGEGFPDMTTESLDREGGSFLTGTQLTKNTPNRTNLEKLTSETEQFTNYDKSETVHLADSSVINYEENEINREDNYQIHLNQQINEVNCKTTSEKGVLLSEINGNMVKEPSDNDEGDVRDSMFISDKEEKICTICHRTSYERKFPTTDENNPAYLDEDSHQLPMKTVTKHMQEPLKKDMEIVELSQTKQYADEMLLDSPALTEMQSQSIHSTQEVMRATQVFKEYNNIQVHLNAEDVQYILGVFGKHKLLWLDYCLGNTEIEDDAQNNENNLAILSDFERILKYHSEIISTSTKNTQVDRNVKEEDVHNEEISLKKIGILLSTLRSRYNMAKPAVTINVIQDAGKPECSTINCFHAEKNEVNSQDNKAGLGVKEDYDEIDLKTGHTIEGAILKEESSTQSTKKSVTGVSGTLFTFAGQLTFTTFQKVLLIYSFFKWLITEVVSSLPDDIKPGPDLYGLPWEAVIVTVLLGLITILVFIYRFYQSITSRLYVGKERRLGQKVAELLDEKCKVLETLSECKHKYEELEAALQNGGFSSKALERDHLEVMSRNLEQSNAQLKSDIEQLKQALKAERTQQSQQEEMLAEMQETLKSLEEESKDLKSQMEQAQTTLKIYDMNHERLQANLQAAKEENALLQESESQLMQEAEGWGERLSELEEEMKMCESSHRDMVEDCTNKDERIKSLTDCLLKMRDWDSEVEDEANGEENAGIASAENGGSTDNHQKQKVQRLIYAAKMSADLKSMEEEKNRVFARLTDEIKAKEDLQDGIEKLQNEKDSLQSESAMYTCETQKLQQKLQIMTEMYQENELKLHRMLTVEERERLQKEEKLTKADKKINLATEELSNYRQRSQELEEELEKTNLAYKNQIASHEKKAHENWLAARAADRDLTLIKRENATLRQKLTDAQFKLEVVEKDPYALECPGRPMFRGERSPFGPSPLGRPSSENRAFLSPPTLMDGPLRLSPQFPPGPGGRASRGPEHPVVSEGVDSERSGGPHSDSGSLSPTWERDRRGPLPPPGYPYPDPSLPYRRPPPGVFPMGPVPPRGPSPPDPHSFGPHLADKSADSYLGHTSDSLGIGENESRESILSLPGELRAAPDPDMRMGPRFVPPMMGPPPPLEPRDHFPQRGSYGPPDFFPLRGPGGPPMVRRPPPPGMFPRFPPPPPQLMGYPPTRPPPESLPGPPPRPSPPGSEQPPEHPLEPQGGV